MSQQGNQGKLPSEAELQRFVKESRRLRFKTVDGSTYVGVLRFFDQHVFALSLSEGDFTLLRANVVGYGIDQSR